MIAHRRADVADLNSRARERMRAAGLLGPELDTPAGSFAVGDHVVVKRNDHRRDINNGDRGRVTNVDPTCGAIEIDLRGRRIRLDRHFLAEPTAAGDPPLVHGYAITGHIAQGLTVDAHLRPGHRRHRPRMGLRRPQPRPPQQPPLPHRRGRQRPRRVRTRRPNSRSAGAARAPARTQQRAGPRHRLRPARRLRVARPGDARTSTAGAPPVRLAPGAAAGARGCSCA